MKIKTSITLTDTVVADIDQVCGGVGRRSAFVEDAIRARLSEIKRRERESRDLRIINEHEDALNAEAADVLEYQVVP